MNEQTGTPKPSRERLFSLDALRGFDMFWIIGGDELCRSLAKVTDWRWADYLGQQMEHVSWEGLRAYDVIFPLFMFIAGVAIPYAILGKLAKGVSRRDLLLKIARRAILLVLLGLVCNGLLRFEFGTLRCASVLGQIGIAYLVAATIVLFTETFRARLLWFFGILVGVAIVQLGIPVPGVGAGVLTPEGCINGYIDRLLLPGRLYRNVFDPEGLLCIVSASGITLLGVLAGCLLRNGAMSGYRKAGFIAGSGSLLLAVGLCVAPWYPPIKSAWTTTFNLQAGGICLLLLALAYTVIDLWKVQRPFFFFRVIGMNSITIYMGRRIVDFRGASNFLFGGLASLSGDFGPALLIVGMIGVEWLALWFLYRKQVFLRV